jgi:flavodoxin
MTVLIVYDSAFGNTELIAKRVRDALAGADQVILTPVGQADAAALVPGDVLIVGSPTQGGRATEAIQRYLADLPDAVLEGLRFAAFDTRLSSRWVKVFGYAGPRVADELSDRGGEALAPAEGFIVEGKQGPLRPGELERASAWATGLLVAPRGHGMQ